MITGIVNANREAVIQLVVGSANGQERQVQAIIDTGFSGYLTLPSSLVEILGLSWMNRQEGVLADGSLQVFDVYAASIVWDGQVKTVEVDATDAEPLAGMSLIYGYELRIQVVENGMLTLEASG